MQSTIVLLLKSTATYSYGRIVTEHEREAYLKGIKDCLSVINEGFTNLNIVRLKLNGLKEQGPFLYKRSIFRLRPEQQLNKYLLAIEHSIDIVNSIDVRFVSGGHSLSKMKAVFNLNNNKEIIESYLEQQ